ncbi:MAG: glycine cleavage system protein GcvH [Phycisphaerales bacterium]|nr:glycine cleavage system protein GcvH [Phycisphaerales bacterium]
MATPSDCRCTETHEWVRSNPAGVTMGITQHAADALTDITYVGLKPVGTKLNAGDSIGEVESVKTTSDIYAIVAGTIVEVNQAAVKDPSLLNSDPYGNGWLVKIASSDTSSVSRLMDAAAYDAKHH